MKKYKLPEDAFDEISLQKSAMMKNCNTPIEVYISDDIWQLIRKQQPKGFNVKVCDKVMGLKIFLVSSPVEYLKHYIKVV